MVVGEVESVRSSEGRLAGVFVVLMSLLALASSLLSGDDIKDVDQIVYEDTLHRMQAGENFYEATRLSLIEKDDLPPTQVRSFRTPVVFEVLHHFPEPLWRVAAGVFFAATIGLSAALAHPFGRYGSVIAAVLAGFWAIAYAPLLYLHAEIWAMPLALGGLLLVRRSAPRVSPTALVLLAGATLVRELFGLLFVLVMLSPVFEHGRLRLGRLRTVFTWTELWPRALAAVGLITGFALHIRAVLPYLASDGYEPPFGNEGMKLSYLAAAIGPGGSSFSTVVGIIGLVLGVAGLYRVRRGDPLALPVAIHSVVLVALTLTIGRVYWGYVSGPLLAAYLPVMIARPVTVVRGLKSTEGTPTREG